MFWKKKKQEQAQAQAHDEIIQELLKPPCQRAGGQHKWRDFPAYIEYDNYSVSIYEPYVCIYCGERKNVRLEHIVWKGGVKPKELQEEIKRMEEQYKDLIKPGAIVEDMVNDAILVDRETLKYWDQIHNIGEQKKETEEERLERYDKELFGDKDLHKYYRLTVKGE
jgi:hypothetical protein